MIAPRTSRTTTGDRPNMPVGGRMRRSGARIRSAMLITKAPKQERPHGASLAEGRARAEDRPPDPDDGGALLRRDRVVVAHAHRQVGPEAAVAGAKPLVERA